MMHEAIFMSGMKKPMSPEELDALFDALRRRLRPRGVSGLLISWNRCFLEMVEGDKGAVFERYSQFEQMDSAVDARILQDGPIRTRRFDGWATQRIDFDVKRARSIFARHPALSLTSPFYRDPMLAFALLYDVQFLMRSGSALAA